MGFFVFLMLEKGLASLRPAAPQLLLMHSCLLGPLSHQPKLVLQSPCPSLRPGHRLNCCLTSPGSLFTAA